MMRCTILLFAYTMIVGLGWVKSTYQDGYMSPVPLPCGEYTSQAICQDWNDILTDLSVIMKDGGTLSSKSVVHLNNTVFAQLRLGNAKTPGPFSTAQWQIHVITVLTIILSIIIFIFLLSYGKGKTKLTVIRDYAIAVAITVVMLWGGNQMGRYLHIQDSHMGERYLISLRIPDLVPPHDPVEQTKVVNALLTCVINQQSIECLTRTNGVGLEAYMASLEEKN